MGGEGEGALFHLGGHEGEGIGAGGGEVLLEAAAFDEAHVGLEDGIRGLVIEDADEEGDHALCDEGIGIGVVADLAGLAGGVEPDLGLAALDEVGWGFEGIGQRRQAFAEADDVFVALGPILEQGELVEQLLLFFGDGHAQWQWSAGRRARQALGECGGRVGPDAAATRW